MPMNQQIILKSRPQGKATVDNFEMREVAVPVIKAGQVLVRHQFLSLDPYMRGRMNEGKSYAAAQPLDSVMIGGAAGAVCGFLVHRIVAPAKQLTEVELSVF